MRQIPQPLLTCEIRNEFGARLRAMHEEVVAEGIPVRFEALLKKLDSSDLDTNPDNPWPAQVRLAQ
ncbi:MAG TPA: NepR family anti-sigma factor [Bryobacteraceae bacterium]|jgi:hypothetical protein|nr:NepR family anti-sigma factor [Bryobacteraceae bacterium]